MEARTKAAQAMAWTSARFSTGPNAGALSLPDPTPASTVDSIVFASEVSLLLPASHAPTQIKCAKNIVCYLYPGDHCR